MLGLNPELLELLRWPSLHFIHMFGERAHEPLIKILILEEGSCLCILNLLHFSYKCVVGTVGTVCTSILDNNDVVCKAGSNILSISFLEITGQML